MAGALFDYPWWNLVHPAAGDNYDYRRLRKNHETLPRITPV